MLLKSPAQWLVDLAMPTRVRYGNLRMKAQLNRLRKVLQLFGHVRDKFVLDLGRVRSKTARFSWGGPDKDLWLIGMLTIVLAVVIAFFPSTVARIILGLPFLLFFPGYTLVAALFPKKGSLGGVERVALSFGLSLAVVPLIGLILNFTPWGIRLEPILISLAVFIIAAAGVAYYRREKLAPEERFAVLFSVRLPFFQDWQGQSMANKVLSVVLVAAIAGAIGTLGYVVATPRVGEKFTEFYILGPNGKAEDYPTELKVGEEGKVILGIVNHEQEEVSYTVEVWIDGEKAKLWINGEDRDEISVELENGEEWEQEVGFVPQKAGEGQKVEFVLYKDGEPYFEEPPYLWIDVDAP
jgi:uncharacterized membrane protein